MFARYSSTVDGAYWKVCVPWRTYQLYSAQTAAASSGVAIRRVILLSAAHRAARVSLSAFGSFFSAASRFSAALLSAHFSA